MAQLDLSNITFPLPVIPFPGPAPLTTTRPLYGGMDLTLYIPHYLLKRTKTLANGCVKYTFWSDSAKTIFVNTAYLALYNFMLYRGYEPSETFEFIDWHPNSRHPTRLIERSFLRRLALRTIATPRPDGSMDINKVIYARFVDNDPDLDYGLVLQVYARAIALYVYAGHTLGTYQGHTVTPEEFINRFFLAINYPYFLYTYSIENGTVDRLAREYPKILAGTGKYRPRSFYQHQEGTQ
jgi:hypothetical protein